MGSVVTSNVKTGRTVVRFPFWFKAVIIWTGTSVLSILNVIRHSVAFINTYFLLVENTVARTSKTLIAGIL
jgi:hypothetical protein